MSRPRIKERRPAIRVYGVEPELSNAMTSRDRADEVVRIQPESVADGLGAPFAGVWTLAMCRRYLDDIVLLDDPTILAGMRFALERLKQVLEPAGAAALAAVLAGRIPIRDGERVAVVASGGNVEVARLGELLAAAGTLPGAMRDRGARPRRRDRAVRPGARRRPRGSTRRPTRPNLRRRARPEPGAASDVRTLEPEAPAPEPDAPAAEPAIPVAPIAPASRRRRHDARAG